MGLSPFRFLYGRRQGRITPTGWVPPGGTYVYALGSDTEAVIVKLDGGNYHQIAQTGDVSAANFIRLSARLRGCPVPSGASWRLVLLVDGAEVTSRAVPTNRTVERLDIAANTSKLSGDHALAIRLQLVGAGTDYELEIPGVYVDSVVLDAATARPALINRVPEPGEIGVPVDTTIRVQIVDVDTDGIDQAATQIYVNGVLAYNGGLLAGWNGPDSANVLTSDTLDITLDPATPFSSTQVVTVRVVSRTVGAEGQLDATYSFTIADVASPRIVEAYPTGERTIVVVFDEPVATGAGDAAILASSYELELASGAPAATPDVEAAAAAASTSEIVLTTNTEMTPGALYRVTATGVEDLAGNVIVAPNNQATFYGWRCAEPPGRDFQFLSWIPQLNRDEDETGDLTKFVGCLQEIVDLLLCRIDRFVDILDPDFAPEDWLDLMLADLGNPFAFDLTALEKRRLVQVLVRIYKLKGTNKGIIYAIQFFLGITVTITNVGWAGAPIGTATIGSTLVIGTSALRQRLYFRVHVAQFISDEQRQRIHDIVAYMKRTETHFAIKEPELPPGPIDHWVIGFSQVGINTTLH